MQTSLERPATEGVAGLASSARGRAISSRLGPSRRHRLVRLVMGVLACRFPFAGAPPALCPPEPPPGYYLRPWPGAHGRPPAKLGSPRAHPVLVAWL
jgi:hypothetical protein